MTEYKEKTLRKKLDQAAEPFKTETQEVKKKGRELYRVALEAIETCERVRIELAAYKAPKLFDKSEPPDAEAKKKKTFYGPIDRLKWFLENDPESPGMKRILETMGISIEQAWELANKSEIEHPDLGNH